MTELYIDGVCVTLPAGFTVTVKRENPFFTKNGEYTYDIALPLTDPVNARLYGFLNRLNSVDDIKTRRRAVLRSENRVFCDGTEVVTGWTDKQVNIQLVSGNSELNYFIGSDRLISSLQMCETNPVASGKPSNRYVIETYPQIDYNLVMTYDAAADKDINKWRIPSTVPGTIPAENVIEPQEEAVQPYDYIPQPYLCAYLRELLKAMGYTLAYNAIEHTPWAQIYIVHINKTYKWNEMLPGWKIKEFLEEVEKLFNVSFFIDSRTREVRILLNNAFLTSTKSHHVSAVIDEYTVECDEEPDEDVLHSNLSYDLPSGTYFKLRSIPDVVWQAAKHRDIVGSMFNFFDKPENQVLDTIFYNPTDDRYYIYQNKERLTYYQKVHEFCPLRRDGATSDISFAIVPAEFAYRSRYWSNTDGQSQPTYLIPTVSGSTTETETPPTSIEEMVEVMQEDSESKGDLFMAFFGGISKPTGGGRYSSYSHQAFTDKPTASPTFHLGDMAEVFYQHGYDIDFKNPVRISSWDPNLFDSQSVVEIRNKRYLCKEVEYVLDAQGRCKPWSGLFYPIRISDTEADARWILADGKWRDGGVWLDSGRWLDE